MMRNDTMRVWRADKVRSHFSPESYLLHFTTIQLEQTNWLCSLEHPGISMLLLDSRSMKWRSYGKRKIEKAERISTFSWGWLPDQGIATVGRSITAVAASSHLRSTSIVRSFSAIAATRTPNAWSSSLWRHAFFYSGVFSNLNACSNLYIMLTKIVLILFLSAIVIISPMAAPHYYVKSNCRHAMPWTPEGQKPRRNAWSAFPPQRNLYMWRSGKTMRPQTMSTKKGGALASSNAE